MELYQPESYAKYLSQSTPGIARDMHKIATQEAAEVAVFRERKQNRKIIKDEVFEANWASARISRPISLAGSAIGAFQDQIDDDHIQYGRSIPARTMEVALVGPSEMKKMLAATHTGLLKGCSQGKIKQAVRDDIEQINDIIDGLRDEQVKVNKATIGAETPDLWLRSIYPEATNWPADVTDLPQLDESGMILNGLWAKAELEMGNRLEAVGTDTLAVDISGLSADMIVAERRQVLEALHTHMEVDTTLADKSYVPRLEVFKAQPGQSLVAAKVVQPADMPFHIPFNDPRATQAELFQPLQ